MSNPYDYEAIARGRAIIDDYGEQHADGESDGIVMIGVLTDLMHMAYVRGISWDEVHEAAKTAYLGERLEARKR